MAQEIYDIVLAYEKIRSHLELSPGDRKKILKCIDEIKGDYRLSVVGVAAKFLENTFLRLYDGVNVEQPEDFNIKKLQKDYHIILVPNHQSHADYIALQYVLYKQDRIPVYVAAGINLNIFPVGDLFKRCGAFFIRRKFDDEVYKLAFQGYLYYLLKTNKVVEFFFEGGRTRTGKLLPPRYGLFSMLLDAHTKFDDKKPLMFVPVSIAHEMIPEETAHAKELSGKSKVKESSTQLLKLYKLLNKKLGTVHVKFGQGIVVDQFDDLKTKTQELAFECFKSVGRSMPITPSSLLALILLDDPGGALTWKQIESRANDVADYCEYMKISLTASLKGGKLTGSLQMAMDMFINNKKVKVLNRRKLGQIFYAAEENERVHLLYHKNMILHHFMVPGIINSTWFNIFNGNIKSEHDLTRFLMTKRKELKYEFYLPSVKEMIDEALDIVSYAVGGKFERLGDALAFSPEQLYSVATKVRRFSTAFSYIYEAYYIASITLRYLQDKPFAQETFLTVARELFELEREHGRVVKYPESFSIPKMKVTLQYFEALEIIGKSDKDHFQVIDKEKATYLIEKFAKDINDQVSINLKFGQDDVSQSV